MGLNPSKNVVHYKEIKIEKLPTPALDDKVVCE